MSGDLALLLLVCLGVRLAAQESVKLGEQCKNTEQCQNATSNSTCSEGFCACANGFFLLSNLNISSCESNDVDKTDEDYTGSSSPPKVRHQKVDVNMVIIMVVLAVMFIGICVALHLFSKARFRNHRTIFNSPHPRLMHIKLGKKAGRRRASHTSLEVAGSRQLSICSSLSPAHSRRGSQAPSPETSQKTRRSNGEKKEAGHHAHHKAHQVDSSGSANGPGSPTVVVTNKGGRPAPPKSGSSSARV